MYYLNSIIFQTFADTFRLTEKAVINFRNQVPQKLNGGPQLLHFSFNTHKFIRYRNDHWKTAVVMH